MLFHFFIRFSLHSLSFTLAFQDIFRSSNISSSMVQRYRE